jgi:biopolymer transport protein ExbB/TolQ
MENLLLFIGAISIISLALIGLVGTSIFLLSKYKIVNFNFDELKSFLNKDLKNSLLEEKIKEISEKDKVIENLQKEKNAQKEKEEYIKEYERIFEEMDKKRWDSVLNLIKEFNFPKKSDTNRQTTNV